MNPTRDLKIFRKVLMEHSFDKDGYEYHFLSIETDEKGWSYNIVVNVVLPGAWGQTNEPTNHQNVQL